MAGLTQPEISTVIYNYVGVHKGYLGDFSYESHRTFYHDWCGLDIQLNRTEGMTTRELFIDILQKSAPRDQAKILRGVLAKYPPEDYHPLRTRERADELRQIIVRLESSPAVTGPGLRITSEIVERAINDAETLIRSSGATSGVDRIHTALQGYLMAACDAEKITYGKAPTLVALFHLLRQNHPKLANLGPRSGDIIKILNSFNAVLDAFHPIRNQASVAHPNSVLLDEAEAMLVINAARTVLHYLDAKLA